MTALIRTRARSNAEPTPHIAPAFAVPLALAAAGWVAAVPLMAGMDMGPATELGSFGLFAGSWLAMSAAMMLPGAVPAVVRHVRAGGSMWLFLGSYLALWAVVGGVGYALYRPHGSAAAAIVVIAAGCYELTPLKQRFRRACLDGAAGRPGTGLSYGLCCLGCSIGLMAIVIALGSMSLAWMAIAAVVLLGQKVRPMNRAVDVPLAMAIIALGIWIAIAPATVPGLMPTM